MLFKRDILSCTDTGLATELEFWSYANESSVLLGHGKRISSASSLSGRAGTSGRDKGVVTSVSAPSQLESHETSGEVEDIRNGPHALTAVNDAKLTEPGTTATTPSSALKQEMMHLIEEGGAELAQPHRNGSS